MKIFFIK